MGKKGQRLYTTGTIKVYQVDEAGRQRKLIIDERFSTRKELRKLIFFLHNKAVITELSFDEVSKPSLFTIADRYELRDIDNALKEVESEY